MEIVAILSTIILIITSLSTIFAVLAYILFKIRERKSRQQSDLQHEEQRRQVIVSYERPKPIELPVDVDGNGKDHPVEHSDWKDPLPSGREQR